MKRYHIRVQVHADNLATGAAFYTMVAVAVRKAIHSIGKQ